MPPAVVTVASACGRAVQDDDRYLRLRDENIALKKENNEQKLIIKR